MEELLYIGPFSVKVLLRSIIIGKNSKTITLEPPQLANARDLILNVMRIESFSSLPSQMGTPPFLVTFDENREMNFSFNNVKENYIHFSFNEGDHLISALQIAYQKWTDITRAEVGRDVAPAPHRVEPGATFEIVS